MTGRPVHYVPAAYGELNTQFESSDALENAGWRIRSWYEGTNATAIPYVSSSSRRMRGTNGHRTITKFRRRPCDASTLRSDDFRKFEQENPKYFPYPYVVHGALAEIVDTIFDIGTHEFADLRPLFPLAAIPHVLEHPPDPFIMRVWRFSEPSALMKESEYTDEEGHRRRGTCICYQMPSQTMLREFPANLLILRLVVGHEIAHYWWESSGKHDPRLSLLAHDDSPSLIEQGMSLFSAFLCAYRGYLDRTPLSGPELEEAYDSLEFETPWARSNRALLMERLQALPSASGSLAMADEAADSKPFHDDPTPPKCELDDNEILALRDTARSIALAAVPLRLGSVGTITVVRKLDCTINFRVVNPDLHPDVSWSTLDRRPTMEASGKAAAAHWRHYSIQVPGRPGEEMSPGLLLSLARHLAHIRLHGGHPGRGTKAPRTSVEIETKCSADDRDAARLLAFIQYRTSGRSERRQPTRDAMSMLLTCDRHGLREIAQRVDQYFEWCIVDPDCPDAIDRYRAEIETIDRATDNVVFAFWGEDGAPLRSTLPANKFASLGENLTPGCSFRLFRRRNGALKVAPD